MAAYCCAHHNPPNSPSSPPWCLSSPLTGCLELSMCPRDLFFSLSVAPTVFARPFLGNPCYFAWPGLFCTGLFSFLRLAGLRPPKWGLGAVFAKVFHSRLMVCFLALFPPSPNFSTFALDEHEAARQPEWARSSPFLLLLGRVSVDEIRF